MVGRHNHHRSVGPLGVIAMNGMHSPLFDFTVTGCARPLPSYYARRFERIFMLIIPRPYIGLALPWTACRSTPVGVVEQRAPETSRNRCLHIVIASPPVFS